MCDPFQSTLPRRERRHRTHSGADPGAISIHAPAKGATKQLRDIRIIGVISIHAPAKGATIAVMDCHHSNIISIHAPAKGATLLLRFCTIQVQKFQSTLPRRERPQRVVSSFLLSAFQSTLPRRERQTQTPYDFIKIMISIHAPAKGATFRAYKRDCVSATISIHAPAKGATMLTERLIDGYHIFQSTLPRRERLIIGDSYSTGHDFNPRSREGSDHFTDRYWMDNTEFQSTLPRRERQCYKQRNNRRDNFNPRSREGSDQRGCGNANTAGNFNPRSREGSDHCQVHGKPSNKLFQSTLPRRERQQF